MRKKKNLIIVVIAVIIILIVTTIALILKYKQLDKDNENSENMDSTQEVTGIIETNSDYIIIDGIEYKLSYVSDGSYRLRKH